MKEKEYGLTIYQRDILMSQLMQCDKPVYNIGGYFDIRADVKPSVFREAVARLVREAAVLSMELREGEGEYIQALTQDKPCNYEFLNYEGDTRTREEIEEELREDFVRLFPPHSPCLYSFKLIRLDKEHSWFYVKFHHLLIDSYGISLILKRICGSYDKLARGEDPEVFTDSYPRFLKDCLEYSKSREYEEAALYWRNKLKNKDFGNLGSRTHGSAIKKITLERSRYDDVFALCRKQKINISHYMLGILALYLRELLDRDEVIVGLPVLNRNQKTQMDTIGLCTNIIPLIITVKGSMPFIEVCREIRKSLKECAGYQRLNTGEIVTHGGLDAQVPFEALFSYEKISYHTTLDAGDVNAVTFVHQQETRALSVFVREFDQGKDVVLDFEYNESIFKTLRIDFFIERFLELFQVLIRTENVTAGEIAFVSKQEAGELLCLAGMEKKPWESFVSVMDEFRRQVRRTPDATAVQTRDTTLTYRRFYRRVTAVSKALHSEGVKKGDFVLVSMERCIDLAAAIYGILNIGAAYVPVDPSGPPERATFIAAQTKAVCLVTKSKHPVLAASGIPRILADEIPESGDMDFPAASLSEDDNAYIMFTSGSTGIPKGALITHGNLMCLLTWLQETYPCLHEDAYLLKTSVTFDVSVTELFGFFPDGGRLFILEEGEEKDPDRLIEVLGEERITHINFVPSMLGAFLDVCEGGGGFRLQEDLSHVKYVMSAGEELAPGLAERAMRIFRSSRLLNLYGPTETTVYAAAYEVRQEDTGKRIPIGKPPAYVSAYIVNRENRLKPMGMAGELCIGGWGVAKGYFGDQELTAKAFISNPYRVKGRLYKTGDQARMRPDGMIEYLGRLDSQIKIRGYRIETGEVETAARAFHGMIECRAAGIDTAYGKTLCLYYTADTDADTEELRRFLAGRIPSYMLPQYFERVESFYYLPSGKLDMGKLPDPGKHERKNPARDGQWSEGELLLGAAFRQVLGTEHVEREDNFFLLGGDSIKAIGLMGYMRKKETDLGIKDIFEAPVLMDMALRLKTISQKAPKKIDGSWFSLSPIQKEFFRFQFEQPQQWNQSVLLGCHGILDIMRLKWVFKELFTAHDSLCMQYSTAGEEPLQRYGEWKEEWVEIPVYEIEDIHSPKLEKQLTMLHASFDLEKGPLIKMAVIKTGREDYLFLVTHHLISDFVSFQILIQDFISLYSGEAAGELELVRSSSYQSWIQYLAGKKKGYVLNGEREFWCGLEMKEAFPHVQKGKQKDSRQCGFVLSVNDTRRLCRKAESLSRIAAMLTAAAFGIKRVFSIPQIGVVMEGHGRELEEINLTRTIGWFTSRFPVLVTAEGESREERLLENLRRLKSVPAGGRHYGLLEPEEQKQLDICFNYLGDLDSLCRDSRFFLSDIMVGDCIGKETKRPYLLDINAYEREGKLYFTVEYPKQAFAQETIERLCGEIKKELTEAGQELEKGRISRWGKYGADFLSADELRKIEEKHPGIEDILPLTDTQRGILYQSLASESKSMYLEQIGLSLCHPLEEEKTAEVLAQLSRVYSVLCTSFLYKQVSEPIQLINGGSGIEFSVCKPEGGEAQVQRLFKEDRSRGFDFESGPLCRVRLIHDKAGQKDKLVWEYHHIVADGWTFALIIKSFFSLYYDGKRLEGPVSYREYFEKTRFYNTKEAVLYWDRYLEGCPESVLPPSLTVRKKEKRERIDLTYRMDKGICQELRTAAGGYSLTVNSLLQTAWGTMLHTILNRNDVIFGTVLSVRGWLEGSEKEAAGVFIKTVPLRIRFTDRMTYAGAADGLQKHIRAAGACGVLPLEDYIRKIGDFGHITVFENYPVEEGIFREVESVAVYEETNYPLTVSFQEVSGNELSVRTVCSCDSYTKEDMDALMDLFFKSLHTMLRHMDEAIEPEAEKKPDSLSVTEVFAEIVEKRGRAVAAMMGDEWYSYQELDEESSRLALAFTGRGIQGGTVGIDMEPSLLRLSVILGILKAGGVYVPLFCKWPEDKKKEILREADAKLLITDREVSYAEKRTVLTAENGLFSQEEMQWQIPACTVRGSDGAYIMYTSGTTGEPKGVYITHETIVRTVRDTNYITITESDRILGLSNYAFDGSVFDIFGTLLNGAILILPEPQEALSIRGLGRLIKKREITKFFVTTALFNLLIDQGTEYLDGVDTILFGGERASLPHVEQASRVLKNTLLLHMYGPTEASVFSTFYPVGAMPSSETAALPTVPIGKPVSHTKIYVLDEKGNEVLTGETGEIYIGGERLALGYWKNAAATKESFLFAGEKGRLYKTGDMGKLLPDGDLIFLGRNDEQVKIRGFRIEPGEIEAALLREQGVRNAAVLITGESEDKAIHAFVAGEGLLEQDLLGKLTEKLPDYMLPSSVHVLENMPVNENGKVDKKSLKRNMNTQQKKQKPASAGAAELETVLELCRELLHNPFMGADEDFLRAGGHSLKAMSLANRLSTVFSKDVTAGDIFRQRTPRNIINWLKKQGESSTAAVKEEAYGIWRPVSSVQKRIYLLEQMAGPDEKPYNITGAFKAEGALDEVRLEQAFTTIIRRHESFRTVFRMVEGEVYGRIEEEVPFTLERVTLNDAAELPSAVIHKFDLERAPLIKVCLVQIRDELFLAVDLHHIIADGVSMCIVAEEISAVYNQKELAPCPFQYSGYILREEKESMLPRMAEQRDYWDNLLTPLPEPLTLPADYKRPGLQSFEGSMVSCVLSRTECELLKGFCRKYDTTLFTALLAVFCIFIYKCSGQEDFIVGIPVSVRNREEFEKTVGMFVNTIPLRCPIQRETQLSDYVLAVKEQAVQSLAFADYPLQRMLKGRRGEKPEGRNALFDVSFGVQESGDMRFCLDGMRLQRTDIILPSSKVDLTVQAVLNEEEIRLELEYCSRLFSNRTAKGFLYSFRSLLQNILSNTEKRICDYSLLSETEEEKIRNGGQTTKSEPSLALLGQIIEEALSVPSDRTAMEVIRPMQVYTGRTEGEKGYDWIVVGGFDALRIAGICNQKGRTVYLHWDDTQEAIKLAKDNGRAGFILEWRDYRELAVLKRLPEAGRIKIIVSRREDWLLKEAEKMGLAGLRLLDKKGEDRLEGLCLENPEQYIYRKSDTILFTIGEQKSQSWKQGLSVLAAWFQHICVLYEELERLKREELQELFRIGKAGAAVTIRSHTLPSDFFLEMAEREKLFATWQIELDSFSESHRKRLAEGVGQDAVTAASVLRFLSVMPPNQKVILCTVLGKEKLEPGDGEESLAFLNRVRELRPAVQFCVKRRQVLPDMEEEDGNRQGLLCDAVSFEDYLYFSELLYEGNTTVPCVRYQDERLERDMCAIEGYCEKYGRSVPGKGWRAYTPVIQKITYGELERRTARIAENLIRKGFGKNDIISFFLKDPLEAASAILGILRAGAAYLPIHTDYPEKRVLYLLEDSGARAVITRQDVSLPGLDLTRLYYSDLTKGEAAFGSAEEKEEPEDLACVIYTSGTTGRPKGVKIRRKSIVNYGMWRVAEYGFSSRDKTLQTLNPAFDGYGSNLYSWLFSGGGLVLLDTKLEKDYEKAAAVIKEREVTNLSTVPAVYTNILENMEEPENLKLRFVVLAGESAGQELIARSKRLLPHVRLINEYGPTECCIAAAFKKDMEESEYDLIGGPIANTELFVLDRDGRALPDGMEGELCIGGVCLAEGYVHSDDKKENGFCENPCRKGERMYRTGDMVRRTASGDLQFLGRRDDQIKRNGYRIALGEIERTAGECPGILQTAAVLRRTKEGGSLLCLFYRSGENGTDEGKLKDFLAGRLPDYMLPAYYSEVSQFPLTSSGKIDKERLPGPSRIVSTKAAPASGREPVVIRAFEEVLKLRGVHREDNFFGLGGDSIQAMQLSARLADFGFSASVHEIFQYPVVMDLCEHIKQEEKRAEPEAVGEFPLTPIQNWFFSQAYEEQNHFNQSVLLKCKTKIGRARLEQIGQELIRRHESLRSCFIKKEDGTIRQRILKSTEISFQAEEDQIRDEADLCEEMRSCCGKWQKSLDPFGGVLFRMVCITAGQDEYWFLVLHHLIVDGVSFRILINDMTHIYESLVMEGKEAVRGIEPWLPEYHRILERYREEKREELLYWKESVSKLLSYVPLRKGKPCRFQEAGRFRILLTEKETGAFAAAWPGSKADTALLALYAKEVCEWLGQEAVVIYREEHGRGGPFASCRLSEAVGWFTIQYPVCIPGAGLKLHELAAETSRILGEVSGKGAGYGIFRYQNILAARKEPEDMAFMFNYQGQYGGEGNMPFIISNLDRGENIGGENTFRNQILLQGAVEEGCLRIELLYNPYCINRKEMEQFCRNYKSNLKNLCKAPMEKPAADYEAFGEGLEEEDFNLILKALSGQEEPGKEQR